MNNSKESKHWYQEPLAIMVFAIPAMTVVAGLLTVWIATQGADVSVRDDLNRFGMTTQVESSP